MKDESFWYSRQDGDIHSRKVCKVHIKKFLEWHIKNIVYPVMLAIKLF